jgi:hypothetical protein
MEVLLPSEHFLDWQYLEGMLNLIFSVIVHRKAGELNSLRFVAILTHCGRVTQICIFTLQLCRTGDADLRF